MNFKLICPKMYKYGLSNMYLPAYQPNSYLISENELLNTELL